MILRRSARSVAAFLLGVMLFAQGAIAFAACEGDREPARAVHHAMDGMDGMVCCSEEVPGGDGAVNPNLCLAHCTSDAQSAAGHVPVVLAAPVVAPLTITPPDPAAVFVLRGQRIAGDGIASPPFSILFQNFRA